MLGWFVKVFGGQEEPPGWLVIVSTVLFVFVVVPLVGTLAVAVVGVPIALLFGGREWQPLWLFLVVAGCVWLFHEMLHSGSHEHGTR